MIVDYVNYSLKNLRKRKLRSWLTMIGIFIGIAAVVSLISLGDGLRNAITGQFAGLGTDKIIVQSAGSSFGPPGSTAVRKLTENDLDIIKNIRNVKVAVGRLLRVVKMEFDDEIAFAFIVSMPSGSEEIKLVMDANDINIAQGRMLTPQDKMAVVLGSDFLSSDIFGKAIRVGNKVNINGKYYQVVGILEKTGGIQGDQVVIMPEESMRELLNAWGEYDLIAVQVDNSENTEKVAEEIKEEFRKDRNQEKGDEDFTVQTPAEVIESIDSILNIVNGIIIGIAAISLLVGGIGIMNTMYTSVLERTREIGVMKAIGARNSDVMTIFLIESGLLGLVGGAIGIAIGIGMAESVEAISSSFFGRDILKVSFSFPLVLGSLVFSVLIGMLSGLFPARNAASLKPVEALRK